MATTEARQRSILIELPDRLPRSTSGQAYAKVAAYESSSTSARRSHGGTSRITGISQRPAQIENSLPLHGKRRPKKV